MTPPFFYALSIIAGYELKFPRPFGERGISGKEKSSHWARMPADRGLRRAGGGYFKETISPSLLN